MFPQRFIDDLRLQADIVRVIQDYVSLKKAGVKFKGLCPFHSEKTPSFTVDQEKGFFHCFGCHAGGDVFKFLELQEKVTFPEAVRMLAQKFGIPMPEESEERGNGGGQADARLREDLLKAHELAAAYFREQLAGPGGLRARQQLETRDGALRPALERGREARAWRAPSGRRRPSPATRCRSARAIGDHGSKHDSRAVRVRAACSA